MLRDKNATRERERESKNLYFSECDAEKECKILNSLQKPSSKFYQHFMSSFFLLIFFASKHRQKSEKLHITLVYEKHDCIMMMKLTLFFLLFSLNEIIIAVRWTHFL